MKRMQKGFLCDKIQLGDNMIKKIINLIITLIIGAIVYYFTLPALNLNNMGFYIFISFLVITFAVLDTISLATAPQLFKKGKIISNKDTPRIIMVSIFGIGALFIMISIVNFICSPLFNAKSYQSRISVNENGNFTKDIEEVNFNQLP